MAVRRAVFLAAFLLVPVLAFAQRTTTGTVTGRIVDANGGVLPGVTVTLKSPEALGVFSGVTDASGTYRVSNLPPATYEIRAELEGFQVMVRQETVRLGGVTQVDMTLTIGSLAETVTVQGESPLVDPERAGLSVNINNLALTSVPVTTNRRFQDVWLMVPGIYVRPDSQEATGSERRTSVDGMDVTDPFGGDIFAVNLNYEAIQDVEIKALGAEASDGASMVGQFMNVVTKSGGNDLHGSAAFFMIPKRFNDSNVEGIAPNNRRDIQPDTTLGGPILRNRIWFFGSYRRIQQDQTVNNAPVPRERRGNLYFVKVTSQLRPNHRLAGTFQYDRTIAKSAVIRGTVEPSRTFANLTSGISSATMQISSPSAFGTRVTGGPLVGANYNWVMSNTRLFQFVASWMVSKPSNAEPDDGTPLGPTKIIQTNAAGNIAGNLTTIAQEGSFGAIDTADRSMLYLAPSMTFYVNRYGSHEFRGGADLYPFIRNMTASDVQPVEFYYRPPGTTGGADVLFERRTLRNFEGTGATIQNEAYERHYAFYFQDRWKPTAHISVKAGVRIETNSIFTKDREAVLGPRLPSNFPTNTADKEFHQTVGMPNVGIAWEAGKVGVFRATALRSYEWLDLGGGDGTSHAPYVLTTDTIPRQPAHRRAGAERDPARTVCAGRQLRRRDGRQHPQRPHLRQRVQRQLGASAAGHELARRDVPVAAQLGLSERRRSEPHSRPGDRRLPRPPVPGLRRGAQHLQPELHLAAEPIDQFPVYEELRRRVGDQFSLLVSDLVPGSDALESDVRHAAVPGLQSGGRQHRLDQSPPQRAAVDVRPAALHHDVLGVLHL